MQIEKLLKKQVQVWDSKVMAIPYASMQYKEHLKQFIDGLVEWEEGKIVQKFRGFPLAEYEEGINDARKLTIVYLKEIRKQLK